MSPTYDSAGRLASVTTAAGTTSYAYSATGQLSQVTAPDLGTLSYSYDGALLTDTTWSSTVSGTVYRTFDSQFRLASESVQGGPPVTYRYDADGLLTAAGALQIQRDPATGFQTGATLGGIGESRTYDAYGAEASYTSSFAGSNLYSVTYTRERPGPRLQQDRARRHRAGAHVQLRLRRRAGPPALPMVAWLGIVPLLAGSQVVAAEPTKQGPSSIELLRMATEKKNVPDECFSHPTGDAALVCAYLDWKMRANAARLLAYRYDGALFTLRKIDAEMKDYWKRGGSSLLDDRLIGDLVIEALFELATRGVSGAVVALFRLGPGEGDYGENLDDKYSILFQRYPSLMLQSWDAIKGRLSDGALGTTDVNAYKDRVIQSYRHECRRHRPKMPRQCREIIQFLGSRS